MMKVVVNELEGCRRGLEVEVPSEKVTEEFERSFREYSRHARIPGFRQGKIPLEVVRRRFGKEVRDEVIGRMVRECSLKALEEKKLEPVNDPVLDQVIRLVQDRMLEAVDDVSVDGALEQDRIAAGLPDRGNGHVDG